MDHYKCHDSDLTWLFKPQSIDICAITIMINGKIHIYMKLLISICPLHILHITHIHLSIYANI